MIKSESTEGRGGLSPSVDSFESLERGCSEAWTEVVDVSRLEAGIPFVAMKKAVGLILADEIPKNRQSGRRYASATKATRQVRYERDRVQGVGNGEIHANNT